MDDYIVWNQRQITNNKFIYPKPLDANIRLHKKRLNTLEHLLIIGMVDFCRNLANELIYIISQKEPLQSLYALIVLLRIDFFKFGYVL